VDIEVVGKRWCICSVALSSDPNAPNAVRSCGAWVKSFSGFLASCGALCNPALAIDCASFSKCATTHPGVERLSVNSSQDMIVTGAMG
jgi:hypothetical protein